MPFMLSDYTAGYKGMQEIQQETEARKGLQEMYKNMPAPDEAGGNPFSTQIGYLQQQIDRAGRSGNVKLWQMLNKQLDDTMGRQSQYEIRSANLAVKKNTAIGSAANGILEGMDPKTGEVSPEIMQGVVQQLSEVDPEKAKNLWINWQAHGQRFTPEMQRGLKAAIAQSMTAKDLASLKETQAAHMVAEEDRKARLEESKLKRISSERESAANREQRRQIAEDRKQQQTNLLKTAITQRDRMHSQYLHEYDSLKKDLNKAVTNEEKSQIISDIEALNDRYRSQKNQYETEWASLGLDMTGTTSSKTPSQFEEGQVYVDKDGNKAKYVNGKWVLQ